MSLGCRKRWIGIPTLPLLICYIFWAELLNDSKPQFPHLYNGRSYSVYCGEGWVIQCMHVCINIYSDSMCGQVVLHSAQSYQGFEVVLAVVVDFSGFVSASHLFWHGCVPWPYLALSSWAFDPLWAHQNTAPLATVQEWTPSVDWTTRSFNLLGLFFFFYDLQHVH